MQIPSQCNPLNNEYCDINYNCDINEGKCISKDINIPPNYTTFEINNNKIIGTKDEIDKLKQNLSMTEEELINYDYIQPPSRPISPKLSTFEQEIIEEDEYIKEPPISKTYKINDKVKINEGPYKNLYGNIVYIDDLNGELGIIPIGEVPNTDLSKYYYFRDEISEPIKDFEIIVEEEEEEKEEEEEEEKPLPKIIKQKKKFSSDLLEQIKDIPDDELENIDIANNITLQCLGLLA